MRVTAVAFFFAGMVLARADGQQLFRDSEFRNGFTLTAASHPAPKVEIGTLRVGDAASTVAPDWRIAQWATRTLLEPGVAARSANGVWVADNAAKRVEVERDGGGLTRLWLEVRGGHEYNGHMRAAGEPWPHLLIEQTYPEPIRLSAEDRLQFTLGMRVAFCKVAAGVPADQLDPGLHTAQVSAYWTVHDLRPGRGDMIWFGIPLFDVRYDVPPSHYAIDGGKADASGKFICVLDGKRFWSGRTGDGEWRNLDTDLLPLIREGMGIAQQQGHLQGARFEDLSITSFNLGWEVTGPYDCAIEFRGLSMKS